MKTDMGQKRMTEMERMRRREQIRRKKKRRLYRKIKRFCVLGLILAVLAAAIGLLLFALKQTGIFPRTKSYEIEAPKQRTDEEVRKKLEDMAKEHEEFQEVLDHYEDYPQVYLAALANNPEMLDYVLGYPDNSGKADGELTKKEKSEKYPLFIQWDQRWGYASYGESSIGISGCGPTCLSMVIFALTGNEGATPDKIARFSETQGYYVEGTGTAWALMTEGAASYGITGTELSLDEDTMKKELKAGHPIICTVREGDFTAGGHFIMIYDYGKKGFSVNDPNCKERSERKWTYNDLKGQIKSLWSFQKGAE